MRKLMLVNGRVFDGYQFIGYKDILIEGNKVAGLQDQISSDCGRIDVKDMIVCPGFIDLHTHGALGWDFTNANSDGLSKVCYFFGEHGVTNFLATAHTAESQKIRSCLRQIALFKEKKHVYDNILGVHLEGPFINEKRKGAMNEQYIRLPSIENYDELVSGYEDIIKTITLAPEMTGAPQLIKYLKARGIYVSLGHSAATYDETLEAVNYGANRATHLFNAMSALNHREPGIAGGVLDCRDVFVEMIADGNHLHPAVIRLVYKIKGPDRCVIVSDSVEPAGLEDGEYNIGGKTVVMKDQICRQKGSDTLCGSTITLDQSVRNLITMGIDMEGALKMVTSNPAAAIGLKDKKGELKPGCDADIVVLDKNLNVVLTIIRGEILKDR